MEYKILQTIAMVTKYSLYVFFALFITMSTGLADSVVGQVKSIKEVIIEIDEPSEELDQVLKTIESQTDFRFFYTDKSIRNKAAVTLSQTKATVADFLKEVSSQTGVEFRQVNTTISVSKSQNRKLQSPSEIIIDEQFTISGQITDENGEGLPGATVQEKGTSNGTITDVDGSYSITVKEEAVLTISFVGYMSQELAVNGRSVIDVRMSLDAEQLDEVVVVGYGTEKKRDLVGSIEKVKFEDIEKQNVTSIAEALQGQASGLYISNNSGHPGSNPSILIRGINSINLGTGPLWIVDGVPIQTGALESTYNGVKSVSPLAMLNPNDIESIEVLKDAAATAIYGNRGSNGVIIVTTKTVKGNSANVRVNYDGGISQMPFDYFDKVVTSEEWWNLIDQAWANTGNTSTFVPDQIITSQFLDERPDLTREEAMATNSDHLEAFTQSAQFHQFGVTANKGFGEGGVMFSMNYRDEKGLLNNNNLNRINGRFSFNFSPTKSFDVGINTNFLFLKNSGVQSGLNKGAGGWGNFWTVYPWYPIYDSNSQTGYWAANSGYNMLASTDENLIRNDVDQYRTISNAFAQWNLPLPGLRLRGEVGIDLLINNSSYWKSDILDANAPFYSEAAEKSVTKHILTYNSYLAYDKTLGIHSVSATIGFEANRQGSYNRNVSGNQIYSLYPELRNPLVITSGGGSFGGEQYLLGYFGRATYKLQDKYIINASVRRDGHSALSQENRWANFSAIGAGWIISDELFFDFPFISLLKLRGSYGITGNTGLSNEMTQLSFGLNNRRYGSDFLPGGTTIGPLGSSSLRWETTTNLDVGIDFGLFEDRINGSIAYYTQDVSDLILRGNVPYSSGFTNAQVWENVGDLENWGWEVSLHSVNINRGGFTWNTDFNISFNDNKIVRLNEFEQGKGLEQYRNIRKEGEKLGTYYMANYVGVDPDRGIVMVEERDQELWDTEFVTRSTGELIPGNQVNSAQNRMVQSGKSSLPEFYGGFTNSFSYKGFDLSVLFVFAGGHYLYNDFLGQTTRVDGIFTIARDMIGNAWENPGDEAKYPMLLYGSNYQYDNEGNFSENGTRFETGQHSMFLEKADYLRLRNLNLGYTIPKKVTDRAGLSNVRVYVGGTNLLTFTGFEGLDPETNNDLPIPRVINFGLSVNL